MQTFFWLNLSFSRLNNNTILSYFFQKNLVIKLLEQSILLFFICLNFLMQKKPLSNIKKNNSVAIYLMTFLISQTTLQKHHFEIKKLFDINFKVYIKQTFLKF